MIKKIILGWAGILINTLIIIYKKLLSKYKHFKNIYFELSIFFEKGF